MNKANLKQALSILNLAYLFQSNLYISPVRKSSIMGHVNYIKDIEKMVRSWSFMAVVVSVLISILPGISVIYLYNEAIFIMLDWIKLVLLSLTIIGPFIFINLAALMTGSFSKSEKDLPVALLLSIVMAGVTLYASLFFSIGLVALNMFLSFLGQFVQYHSVLVMLDVKTFFIFAGLMQLIVAISMHKGFK